MMAEPNSVLHPHTTDEAFDADQGYLTIGSLAKRCGVTVRTLRYYEEMDLIGPVKRTSGQYRLYNQHSVKRVNAILALQALNYTLEEVLVTLGSYSKRRDFSKSEQIEATRRSLQLQRNCIDDKLRQLKQMRKDVEERLQTLDSVCHPCLEQNPETACSENCAYLTVHD